MINRILVYLKLASHCEEGFEQLVELLLVCLPPNVLVHLHDDEEDNADGDEDGVYLLKCTISLAVPLETAHSQAQLSTCGRLLIVVIIVLVAVIIVGTAVIIVVVVTIIVFNTILSANATNSWNSQ